MQDQQVNIKAMAMWVSGAGAWVVDKWVGLSPPAGLLFEVMALDFITGCIAALFVTRTWQSRVGVAGLGKKVMVAACVYLTYRLEQDMPAAKAAGLYTASTWAFIAMEVTSIVENLARAKVLPPGVREAIERFMPGARPPAPPQA